MAWHFRTGLQSRFARAVQLVGCALCALTFIGLQIGLPAGPALAQDPAPWINWQSQGLREHPLTGRIWSAARSDFVSVEELAGALADARFVLLGETHDNPDHHRLQAWAVQAMVAAGRRPAVVFEMLGADQQSALEAFELAPAQDNSADKRAEAFFSALDWEKRGWPERALYRTLLEAVFANRLPIRVGDVSRKSLRAISRGGPDAPSDSELARLKVAIPFSSALADDLDSELEASHCGMLPKAALAPMARAQRLRDAVLADNLIKAAAADGAVLIAGSGHVRGDRAVPWYLRARGAVPELGAVPADGSLLTLAMAEVIDGAERVDELIERGGDGKPVYDYVWFTPRTERPDPCEELRAKFAKPPSGG